MLQGPIPESVELYPGDTILLRYQMIDWGTWVIAYQVGHIEGDLEADPRLKYLGYSLGTDGDRHLITFKVRVRDVPRDPETQTAGVLAAAVKAVTVSAIILGAGAWTWLYYNRTEYEIQRGQWLMDKAEDVNASPAEREAAIEAMGDRPATMTDAIEAGGKAVMVLALAAVVYIIWKG